MSFEYILQDGSQVWHYRISKLPGTGNTFNRSLFPKIMLDICKLS